MRASQLPLERRQGATRLRRAGVLAAAAVAVWSSGCAPVSFEATTRIPKPLITPIPVTVGLYVPEEFSSFVHREERWGTKWEVALGKAQTEGLTRLVGAMFQKVVPLDSIMGAVADPQIRAIIEPELEAYSFVTPRDAGAPYYAVSLKYRIGLYAPDGKLVESWPFTGYGSVENSGFGGEDSLQRATSIAMRDAGAKLAVEFRQQAMVRGLLPEAALGEPLPAGLARPDAAQTGTAPGTAEAPPDSTPEIVPPPGTSTGGEPAAGEPPAAPVEDAPGESAEPQNDAAPGQPGQEEQTPAPQEEKEEEKKDQGDTNHFAALAPS